MKNTTFIPYIYDQNLRDGYSAGIHVILPTYDKKGEDNLKHLIENAAWTFGVSKSAVKVNMEKYGLLVPARDFNDAKKRLAKYSR